MPRDLRATNNMKMAKLKRERAMMRPEILQPSTPRTPASGVTSMAVKAEDPETRRMIDEALARRSANGQ